MSKEQQTSLINALLLGTEHAEAELGNRIGPVDKAAAVTGLGAGLTAGYVKGLMKHAPAQAVQVGRCFVGGARVGWAIGEDKADGHFSPKLR